MPVQREHYDWLGLSGRVAVVTGAGSGIGAAIADGFATAGARVAVIDRDGEAAANVASRLSAAGRAAIAFTCDVTTGVVTFLAGHIPAAGAAVQAGFLFDVPVRFDTDYLEVDLSAFAAGAIPKIPLMEIRP